MNNTPTLPWPTRWSLSFRVAGDSMAPFVTDGAAVVGDFIELSDVKPGEVYILCLDDGRNLFRYITSITPDTVTIAAYNQDDYPGEETIDVKRIVNLCDFSGILAPASQNQQPRLREYVATLLPAN